MIEISDNRELIVVGATNALEFLVNKYDFDFISEEVYNLFKKNYERNQYVIVVKNEIYICVAWNIYEGLNIELIAKNEKLNPYINLANLKMDLIPEQKKDEAYKEYLKRRKKWLSKYRDIELLKLYKENNPMKYYEYYILTELKIIEDNFPSILRNGAYEF